MELYENINTMPVKALTDYVFATTMMMMAAADEESGIRLQTLLTYPSQTTSSCST